MDRLTAILHQSALAVVAFKLRTFFCLVSVALGIASITIIVAATEGAYQKAFDLIDRFGPDSVLIIGGSEESRAVGKREKTLTLDDVQSIKESFPGAYLVVPMTSVGDTTVSYRSRNRQTRVVGSSNNYGLAWSWPVVEGSDFTEEDVKGARNVGLIGRFLVDELFLDENPVGRYVLVKGIPVQIVGVLAERGTSPTGDNHDDRIVLPVTTVMKKLQNERKYVSIIRVRFRDQKNLYPQVEELTRFLREKHGIPDGVPDDFRIISPREIIKFLVALTGSLVVFLGIVGVISLVVAGFVLANLFLLSVKERTREIGIRRSVGARRQDILLQFLGESVLITSAGGVLGFAVGLAASKLLVLFADIPVHFSWKAFAVGLGLSWAVGIGFGLQPASRAANLNPVEALRG